MEQGQEPVNYGRRESDADVRMARNFQSVRTVLEGLILVGIIWLASSVQDQAKATVQMQTQIANLSLELVSVPELSRQVAQMQVRQTEHDRRIQALEGRPR